MTPQQVPRPVRANYSVPNFVFLLGIKMNLRTLAVFAPLDSPFGALSGTLWFSSDSVGGFMQPVEYGR